MDFTTAVWQFLRVTAVVALLAFAALAATPRGRIPLALRGLMRIMKKDRGIQPPQDGDKENKAPLWKRLLAFVLAVAAAVLAMLP